MTHDVPAKPLLVDENSVHGTLDAIETGGFPHEVDEVVANDLRRDHFALPQSESVRVPGIPAMERLANIEVRYALVVILSGPAP